VFGFVKDVRGVDVHKRIQGSGASRIPVSQKSV